MADNLEMIWSIVGAIFAILMIVVIHEWGHFVVARWCGVRVLRFSVGFGPAIWSVQSPRTGTVFQVSLVPLGGYVKFAGEQLEDAQPPWQRILIASAGPLVNLLLAVLLYSVINMTGVRFVKPVVGKVAPHSLAAKAQLSSGQEIIAVGGRPIQGWASIATALLSHVGDVKPVIVTTHDKVRQQQHQLNLSSWSIKRRSPDLIKSLGITPEIYPIAPIIASVQPHSPAQSAGMKPGDRIVQFGKIPITDWMPLLKLVESHPNTTQALIVQRGTQQVRLIMHIGKLNGKGHVGAIVQVPPLPKSMEKLVNYSPIAAVSQAVSHTSQLFALNAIIIAKMLTGHVSIKTLGGPISIFQVAGKASHAGWVIYLRFMAFVSVALAFLNLLPIPMLDGGHIVLYAIEWCRGKPISERYQIWGLKVGLFLILWLMLLATFNDVMRLV